MKHDNRTSLIMLGWPLRLPILPAVLLTGMALSAASAPAAPLKQIKPQPGPVVLGRGYYAVLPNKLLLASQLQADWKDASLAWSKLSGPGEVKFERPNAATTWATANQPGKYVFQLSATLTTASSVRGKGSEPENAVDVSSGPSIPDFVEGSYMIKHGGAYYLLYSSGALHDGSYCVRYGMAKHPFGPFTTPPNHTILTGHIRAPDPGWILDRRMWILLIAGGDKL